MQRSSRPLASARRLGVFLASLLMLGAALAAPSQAWAQPSTPADGSNPIYLPQVLLQSCKEIKAANLMGTQIYDGTRSDSIYHQPLLNSGATWVRTNISWSQVEPANTTPDKYNWTNADYQVSMAYQRCWPVVLTLGYNPSWASSLSEGYLDRTSASEMAQLMGAVAERYDGDGVQDAPGSPKVFYFEMYNEPDVGENSVQVRWGDAPDKYADMLKAVYPAIKAASPQAQVVFGGIAFDFFTDQDPVHPENNGPFVRAFLENVLKNGGGSYFDIMNFHFYPLFGANWTDDFPKDGPGLVEKTEAVRALMLRYNINKPIIITEAGWHNNATIPYGDDTLQVRYVQKLYTQAKAAGVSMLAWWPFSDISGSYGTNSGLVADSGAGTVTFKPAYYAYGVFTREMINAAYVGEIAAGSDIKVYKFRDDTKGRTVYVAWTNPTDRASAFGTATIPYQDTTRSANVTLVGSSAKAYDAFWTKVADVTDAGDGRTDNRVKISIDGNPRYIIVEGN